MNQHEKINYIELPAEDLAAVRSFFEKVFDWEFTDYGPDYLAFTDGTLDGGFYRAKQHASTDKGSVLVILYSDDLESTQKKIIGADGKIIKPVFSFPGGRRFHFIDPNGNEFAVWSEV